MNEKFFTGGVRKIQQNIAFNAINYRKFECSDVNICFCKLLTFLSEMLPKFAAVRKSFAIFMMTVYGILSIGVHLHAHYCCGNLTELSLYEPVKSCCAHDDHSEQDGPVFKNNCCDFDHYDLKIDETHAASYNDFVLPPVIIEELDASISVTGTSQKLHVRGVPANGPPSDTPLFIKHHALVLYA